MTNEIAYTYVRRACKKILIPLVILIFILLFIPWLLSDKPLGSTEDEIRNVKLVYFAAVALPLLGIFYCILMITNPQLHGVFRRIKKYGSAQSIAAQIDTDAEKYSETIKLSKAGYAATFTPSWLIWSRGIWAMQVRILNFADIKQIYQHTTVVNGVAQYALDIRTTDGKKTNMDFYRNQALINQIMNRIAHHAPQVKIGYDG